MGRSYRDLRVWQEAVELSVVIYALTRSFPKDELYGLTSQLRRAAVSIPSNIAEGYGRASRQDFRRIAAVARGSVLEVQTQLTIAARLGLAEEGSMRPVLARAEDVGKMLWALMLKLNSDQRIGTTPDA
jgi:four helix bundle protein